MKYLDYVNIKQGTDSARRFSNGNTLPLTALPHAMAAFAPQTSSERGSWFYHPKDRSLEGIRLTHQPSPWVGDFSYFCFMPQAEEFFAEENNRWSGFRPKDAELHPHYMKLNFMRYGATVKLAPTDSGAAMNVKFEKRIKKPLFAVLPPDSGAEISVDGNMITGYTASRTNAPFHDKFKCWFVLRFDCAIMPLDKNNRGLCVMADKHDFNVSLAISYISPEQALLNLEREAGSFDEVKAHAEKTWEDTLSLICVECDDERKKVFYSCMYRAFLYPTKFYETDKIGNILHVVPETGEIKKGVMYTNNGFCDTYRTVYPLYSILIPHKLKEILRGFLNFYDDTGYLPRWPSPSEFGCMPGTLIEALYADAAVKNILDDKDLARALDAMLKNAEIQATDPLRGRKCVAEYATLGYVPYDKCHESVNETLDCAYGDYCISVVAGKLGKKDIQEKYIVRSKNYRNLFDAEVGFMRARDSNGKFRPDFNSFFWGRDYTEGSAWQSSFAVPHDIDGLSELYGGKGALIAKIDELMTAPIEYNTGGYGAEIHEITEMAAIDFGQCAISNQPSFHIPYMFSALGQKSKTEYWVERLVTETFTSADDGFPGDEDNGTMSCWYIFSCLGLYPYSPGKDEYVLSKPLLSAQIRLDNGKILKIETARPINSGCIVKHKDIF